MKEPGRRPSGRWRSGHLQRQRLRRCAGV